MKASIGAQRKLLELAGLDAQVLQLAKQTQQLLKSSQLETLSVRIRAVRAEILQAQQQLEAVTANVQKLTDDIATVAARKELDQTRLNTASDPKVALGLEREIAQLDLRAERLHAKLQVEQGQEQAATAQLAASKAEFAAVKERGQQEQAQVRKQTEALNKQAETANAARKLLAAELDGQLLAEYERIRQEAGIGAARLRRGVSEASGMQLSPGFLAQVAQTPAEDLIYCPATGVILVRTEEN